MVTSGHELTLDADPAGCVAQRTRGRLERKREKSSMEDSRNEKLSFEEFRKVLAEALLVPEERLTPEASFTADLSVDSIRWVEMALSIEQIGVQVPTEAFWDIDTVGDAYDFYVKNYAEDA